MLFNILIMDNNVNYFVINQKNYSFPRGNLNILVFYVHYIIMN